MNYAYTSARVRALENSLPSKELIRSLAESRSLEECIQLLNSAGFDGITSDEIIGHMKEHHAQIISELIENKKDIEVIFYPKTFHNLKAAVKTLYSKSIGADVFYSDALIDGAVIMDALKNKKTETLPQYISKAAWETYLAIMRTGDGRLSDMTADKACLEAMKKFAEDTEHEILKSYVNETIAAADIKTVFRAENASDFYDYLVSCKYFSAEVLAAAAESGRDELTAFLSSAGFEGINEKNADIIFENRISQILAKEKYNILSPAPAINFILEHDRAVNTVRYILICRENGAEQKKILERVSIYV